MPVFDQRGQHVTYQYNAAGDINLAGVQNRADLTQQLERLYAELKRAAEAGTLDDTLATEAKYHLHKATVESKQASPDKKSLMDHLGSAGEVIKTVAGLGGLFNAIVKAAEMAGKYF